VPHLQFKPIAKMSQKHLWANDDDKRCSVALLPPV